MMTWVNSQEANVNYSNGSIGRFCHVCWVIFRWIKMSETISVSTPILNYHCLLHCILGNTAKYNCSLLDFVSNNYKI